MMKINIFHTRIVNLILTILVCCVTLAVKAQQWESINPNCNCCVETFSADSANHKLYATGVFTCDTTLTNPFYNLAVYDATNNTWGAVGGAAYEFDCGIWSKTVLYDNGDVYVGGDFNPFCPGVISGTGYIAKYNGVQWGGIGGGFCNPIYSPGSINTIVKYNGNLYAGGTLRNFYPSNDTCNAIGYWDGNQWNALGGGGGINTGVQNTQASNYFGVTAMIEYNNLLFVSGIFNRVGNIYTYNGVATWDANGWDTTGLNIYTGIDCFGIYNNELYAGGEGDLIKYNPNGAWQQFAHPTSVSYPVGIIYSIIQYKNDLIVTGLFDTINGVAANGIARWDGQQWHPFGTGLRFFDSATSQFSPSGGSTLAVLDGCLYVSGSFNYAGSVYNGSTGIARWCEPTGYNELLNSNVINVFPNPIKDILSVNIEGAKTKNELNKLVLYDVTGKEVMHCNFKKNITVNANGLSNGIYMYKVYSENVFLGTGKVIKE